MFFCPSYASQRVAVRREVEALFAIDTTALHFQLNTAIELLSGNYVFADGHDFAGEAARDDEHAMRRLFGRCVSSFGDNRVDKAASTKRQARRLLLAGCDLLTEARAYEAADCSDVREAGKAGAALKQVFLKS